MYSYIYTHFTMQYVYFRTGLSEVKGIVKPFDWTYTTDYKGTLFSEQHHKLEVRHVQCYAAHMYTC